MRLHNTMFHRLVLSGLMLAFATTAAGAGEVIANSGLDVSAADIKDIFLGEKQLAGSIKIQPVDNGVKQSAFLDAFLKIDASKYQKIWTKKAFRDGLNTPPVKGSDAEVIAFVKNTPGAVGYIDGSATGVKVLQKF